MADNNSNTSDNPESGTELSDFSALKPFNMKARKKFSNKNYSQY